MTDQTATRPLHERFARLARRLPHVALLAGPTPVRVADGPAGRVACKLDGATSPVYGGNKVRKLEVLLGQALAHDCRRVATFGAAGSNHATATAVHAAQRGLRCVNFLSRQRRTPWIADNLRRQVAAGATLVWVDGDRASRERQARDYLAATDEPTWLIPMGGSSPAGTVGYVNAGLELAAQIDEAEAPAPDRLYVPLGTMGTAVTCSVVVAAVRVGC